MLEFLYRLFIGHRHVYEIIHSSSIMEELNSTMPCGKSYILQCKICGKMKHKNFIV